MAKLKDHIIKQQEHSRLVFDNLRDALANVQEYKRKHNSDVHKDQPEEFLFNPKGADIALKQLVNRSLAKVKHQWSEDMPDLEGEALADAEKQFDYDSWLGEHGIGE